MLKFRDNKNWFNDRVAWIKKDYFVPQEVKNGVCLDIGSNVGAFPYVYHYFFKKIYCIEASQESFKKCRMNTAKFKNVECFRYAVSDKSHKILKLRKFMEENHVSGNASTLEDEHWYPTHREFEEVPSICLESIYKKLEINHINYLKIDCEGAEYDFFMNKDLSKIDYISAEIHIQMGLRKSKELQDYLETFFIPIKKSGNCVNTHIKVTYKNKRLAS